MSFFPVYNDHWKKIQKDPQEFKKYEFFFLTCLIQNLSKRKNLNTEFKNLYYIFRYYWFYMGRCIWKITKNYKMEVSFPSCPNPSSLRYFYEWNTFITGWLVVNGEKVYFAFNFEVIISNQQQNTSSKIVLCRKTDCGKLRTFISTWTTVRRQVKL